MPNYTIYIRQIDNDKWAAIKDKPEFIHNALNDTSSRAVKYGDKLIVMNGVDTLKTYDATTEINAPPNTVKPIKTPKDAEKAVKPFLDEEQFPKLSKNYQKAMGQLCKIHGTPLDSRGKCLQKGCKYGA